MIDIAKIFNTFEDTSTSTKKQIFYIGNKKSLDECWDYFYHYKSDFLSQLSTLIPACYHFFEENMKLHSKVFFKLVLENSPDFFYLTIWNQRCSDIFSVFLKEQNLEFISKGSKTTIKVHKEKENSIQKTTDNLYSPITEDTEPRVPYDFLAYDDLVELSSICEDMQDTIIAAKKHGVTENIYSRLRSAFSLFSLQLRGYEELETISKSIENFSNLINSEEERFLQLSDDEIQLIDGLIFSFERWLKTLFIDGGEAIDFMDASLNADMDTISIYIRPQLQERESVEDLDAIFDF